MKKLLLLPLFLTALHIYGQSISSETIEIKTLKPPKVSIDASSRTYNVTVNSPYNLTIEDVKRQSQINYENDLANYDNVVLESEKTYQQKLSDYEAEEKKAQLKYEKESEEFQKLSLLERMALIDQGKNPKLVLPSKPVYYKPSAPVYREPNLNDYIIADNNTLANRIDVSGFKRGNPGLDIFIDIQPINFQDISGQAHANQPTKLIIKLNGADAVNATFFDGYDFISSSPINNINKSLEEKRNLDKIINFLNEYINEMYGYQTRYKKIKILSVKNKKNVYDELERANIYVTTNLRKLQGNADSKSDEAAVENMKKGTDIWENTLKNIEYKNDKSDFNSNIAKFIYFNLIRIQIGLDNKKEAEKYLNEMQENLIYIKLSANEERELKQLEKEIYKSI
ncbi:hypothetical protein LJB95_02035 [Paludibacteraceae bacterium OttesenSCG-928-F17]|nr:hypothetical protein [Paludibacteraceae bacterium OttesenSCG-928-F17]